MSANVVGSVFAPWRFVRFTADQKAATAPALIAEELAAIGGPQAMLLADRKGPLTGGVLANVGVPTTTTTTFRRSSNRGSRRSMKTKQRLVTSNASQFEMEIALSSMPQTPPKRGEHVERVKYTRKPYLVVSQESAIRKDVYGSIEDHVVRQAQLLRGADDSDTVIVAMHPIGSPAYLPLFSELARTGLHVIGCANRYPIGDNALQMENVLLDIGACIRDAKERLGYERVILAGWSGGGSPMMGYQAEAEAPQISQTAAGEPTLLAETSLPAADGVMLLAAPRSRHRLLTDFLDASITDELQPERNQGLDFDLYGPRGPKPPYSADFVAEYRKRQRQRSRRITEFARDKLDSFRAAGRPHDEYGFVVHGTMADPRWLDPTIDPNGRMAGWSYLGDPAVANNSPGALMRFSTLRSWLSQWSLDAAQIDAADAAPRVTAPALIVINGDDDAVPASHPVEVYGAIRHADKEIVTLEGANHYFSGSDQKSKLTQAADLVHDWIERHR